MHMEKKFLKGYWIKNAFKKSENKGHGKMIIKYSFIFKRV